MEYSNRLIPCRHPLLLELVQIQLPYNQMYRRRAAQWFYCPLHDLCQALRHLSTMSCKFPRFLSYKHLNMKCYRHAIFILLSPLFEGYRHVINITISKSYLFCRYFIWIWMVYARRSLRKTSTTFVIRRLMYYINFVASIGDALLTFLLLHRMIHE